MAGFGTYDRDLIRLVVTRCEVDMADIKEEFNKKYGKTLKSFIKGDTSGDYKHALYALIGENRS
jgi:annexin A7/11